jgi:hypothetical protein
VIQDDAHLARVCDYTHLNPVRAGVVTPEQSGLRQTISWSGKERVAVKGPIRLRIDFGGIRPEDIKFYAAYVTPAN